MEIFSVWKNLEKVCVSFSSFSTFKLLLEPSASPAVQYWAVWTMHHFCSKNRKMNKHISYQIIIKNFPAIKYCELISREIGTKPLKKLQENTNTNHSIKILCQKTLLILERRNDNKKSLTVPQMCDLGL
jgi:hypothetical protein